MMARRHSNDVRHGIKPQEVDGFMRLNKCFIIVVPVLVTPLPVNESREQLSGYCLM